MPDVAIDGILATSAKALALDNKLAEAHASRGFALSLGKRYEEAEKEFEQATTLDPNSFEAHYLYGRACFAQGELERTAALLERSGRNRAGQLSILDPVELRFISRLAAIGIKRMSHGKASKEQNVNSLFTLRIRGRLTSALVPSSRLARRTVPGNGYPEH